MPTPQPQNYKLGRKSKRRLQGVHPHLVRVVERAIELTTTDFTVLEGVRTKRRQRQLVNDGKSKTMNSRHIPAVPKNHPEFGEVAHAVDLVAWTGDALSWDIGLLCNIADAVRQAAAELNVPIVWGGCWDEINLYISAPDACLSYTQRKEAAGQTPFIDAAHFELKWEAYPV